MIAKHSKDSHIELEWKPYATHGVPGGLVDVLHRTDHAFAAKGLDYFPLKIGN